MADRASQDRRRRGATGGMRTKLSVNEALLDRNKYEYRYINDANARVYDLTERDDWELVSDPSKSVKQDGTDIGGAVSTVVGKDEGGEPIRAYLVRKPKEFADADRRARDQQIDDQMNQIARGPSPDQGGIGIEPSASYVPDRGIQIQEGAKR